MSYVLTFLGFAVLVILHEAGHFAAAKAVGMRVERFSLFFGNLLVSFRRGETEYGIGWLPAGGYVKITGMNPNEELTPELEARAYYNQKPWKRIVVILAGPAVNFVLAFVILLVVFLSSSVGVQSDGQQVYRNQFVAVATAKPAEGVLRSGDVILSVDGQRVTGSNLATLTRVVSSHRCATAQVAGCRAATPITLTVQRGHSVLTERLRPVYNASLHRMLLGVKLGEVNPVTEHLGVLSAAGHSFSAMWTVASATASRIGKLFESKERSQIHGIVGGFAVTQEEFSFSAADAFYTLGLISLSLAVVNLFPFLPLDGGHVFWAVAEKVRGRRIAFSTMERAGIVGFVLILALFVVGLSNDINTLSGKGFGVR